MKKTYLFATSIILAGLLSACAGTATESSTAADSAQSAQVDSSAEKSSAKPEEDKSGEKKELIVGASPAPHAEILTEASALLAEKGYELKIVEYTDYVQPNNALEFKDLDANYFQHLPYLEEFNAQYKTNIASAAAIHYEPFGIYPGKTKSLEELKEGAKIAVPNDVTNEARALLLLADQGLIGLKEGAGLTATKNDIVENPKNLEIIELEAAQIPRSLEDVDLAVINGNYAIEAGFKVKDAVALEDEKSIAAQTYANIIAVRKGEENNEAVQALIDVLQSEEIRKFIEEKYEGSVVPIF
ncbi:MAG: MetQ/NlpA family ABC transporter substrate-binding protein [Johnsonella sp.]|nr:MetQ/NlpA family ABC transporter substrate-binding protein [Johnsonella sp.]